MSDATPPPPPAVPAGGVPAVPPGALKIREPIVIVLLSFITLGIYFLFWNYQVFREMKETTREGVGPVVGLILAIFVGFVNWFLIPSEIGTMYANAGKDKPVSGVTGFWNFLPIIGWFIWLWKVQGALNRRWEELGATR